MPLHFMSISDFAYYKNTSRQTVYNNLGHLTTQEVRGKLRIVLDEKSESWSPKEHYRPKKHSNNED